MKNYFYAMASLAAFGLSSQAQAREVTFNFLVNSSGMEIYPCDAGILDSGVSGSSSHLQASRKDYGSSAAFLVRDIPAMNVVGSKFYTVAYPQLGGFTTGSVFTKLNNVIENNTGGTGLIFNLASDVYGASYFVDLCVRAPKLHYMSSGTFNYVVRPDSVTAHDLSLSGNYLTSSGVQVTSKLVCDSRTNSTDFSDWSSTNITDNLTAGSPDTSPANLLRLDGTGTTSLSGSLGPSPAPVNGTAFSAFGSSNSFTTSGAPIRYCVVRYLFRETSLATRLWDPLQAKFTINFGLSNTLYTPPTP